MSEVFFFSFRSVCIVTGAPNLCITHTLTPLQPTAHLAGMEYPLKHLSLCSLSTQCSSRLNFFLLARISTHKPDSEPASRGGCHMCLQGCFSAPFIFKDLVQNTLVMIHVHKYHHSDPDSFLFFFFFFLLPSPCIIVFKKASLSVCNYLKQEPGKRDRTNAATGACLLKCESY